MIAFVLRFKGRIVTASALCALVVSCADQSLDPARPTIGEGRLHGQFLDARARMDEPYIIAGECDEGRCLNFAAQLEYLGDERFANELGKESPDVVSAVGYFVAFDLAEGDYPRTRALLDQAPEIPFEAARVTEEDSAQL